MLDADSVFERLLREAANLVPKMSTPKLTNAMKVTSSLQQKITDTVTSRLLHEKGTQQLSSSNMQQISFASLFPPGLISDTAVENCESDVGTQRQTFSSSSSSSLDERQAPDGQTSTTSTGLDVVCGGCATTYSLAVTLMPPGNISSNENPAGDSSSVAFPTDVTMMTTAVEVVRTTTTVSSTSPTAPGFPSGTCTPSPSSSAVVLASTTGGFHPDASSRTSTVVGDIFLTSASADVDEAGGAVQDQLTAGGDGPAAATAVATVANVNNSGSGIDEVTGYSDVAGEGGGSLLDDQTAAEAGLAQQPTDHLSINLTDAAGGGLGCPIGLKPEPVDSSRLTILGFRPSQVSSAMCLGSSSSVSSSLATSACADLIGPLASFPLSSSSPATAASFCPSVCFASPLLPIVSANQTPLSDHHHHELMLVPVCSSAITPTTTTATGSSAKQLLSASSLSSGGGGPYRCRDCDKEFRILRYLEKHRRIHTGEKPYQCCYCGRQFNDWPNMNRHKRIHTGERPYRCSVCAKTFSQPAVYNEHVKRHTGERPHICIVCAKGFPRAARLAVHMRVHTGERPYPCTSCDRRFSQPHHLAAHLRVHSGDRPYACNKCHVSFACISNLRRHRKQVHPNSPILSGELSNNNTSNNDIVNVNNNTGEVVLTLNDEKKPSLQQCLNIGAMTRASSGVVVTANNNTAKQQHQPLLTDPTGASAGGMASLAAAAAAAMSGGLLGGAAVGTVGGTSIPGLILTPGPQGTLIAAAPAGTQFATVEQSHHHHHHQQQQHHHHQQQHQRHAALIGAAHAGGLAATHGLTADSSGLLSVATSTGSFSMATAAPQQPPPLSSSSSSSDLLFKSVSSLPCSTTLSLVLPTVLSSTASNHTVTFLAPQPPPGTEFTPGLFHLTESGAAPIVSVSGGGTPGLVVNSVSGETVYLEPLDPRHVTFEHGQQQFTLATIPAGAGSSSSGHSYPLHPLQLQPAGGGGATHIAFATSPASLPQQQQLIAASPIFSSSAPPGGQAAQQHLYTSSGQQQHQSATILFPSQQQQQAVVSNPSQMLHYHHRASAGAGGLATQQHSGGGRPSSTPTTTMLVPILQQQHRTEALVGGETGCWPPGANFVTLATAAAGGVVVSHPTAGVVEPPSTTSRPASVLSNLSAPSPSTATAAGVVVLLPTVSSAASSSTCSTTTSASTSVVVAGEAGL